MEPNQPIPIRIGNGGFQRPKNVRGTILTPWMRKVGNFLPGRSMIYEPFLEQPVFFAAARQDSDELSSCFTNVAQIISAAQLTIRYIKKLWISDKATQYFPCLDMSGAVFGVSIGHFEVYRHRPVGAHRKDPQQLFQIWPVVFIDMWLATY